MKKLWIAFGSILGLFVVGCSKTQKASESNEPPGDFWAKEEAVNLVKEYWAVDRAALDYGLDFPKPKWVLPKGIFQYFTDSGYVHSLFKRLARKDRTTLKIVSLSKLRRHLAEERGLNSKREFKVTKWWSDSGEVVILGPGYLGEAHFFVMRTPEGWKIDPGKSGYFKTLEK